MNPFALRGPEFLVFYVVFGALVLLALRFLARRGEPRASPRTDFDDPYEIAFLRGGAAEAFRVATVALVDRGLLRLADSGDRVVAARDASTRVVRPIEREIVSDFKDEHDAAPMALGFEVSAACEEYRTRLEGAGLIPDRQGLSARSALLAGAIALLVGVSAIKLVVALVRGRGNLEFLVLLTVLFVVAAKNVLPRRTQAGDAMLATLKARFASVNRIRPGGATNELSYAAALYGLAVLPTLDFPYVKQLFPKASKSQSSSSGGCGSGGCGSGGCGGGCGGCGGCG